MDDQKLALNLRHRPTKKGVGAKGVRRISAENLRLKLNHEIVDIRRCRPRDAWLADPHGSPPPRPLVQIAEDAFVNVAKDATCERRTGMELGQNLLICHDECLLLSGAEREGVGDPVRVFQHELCCNP